MKFPSKEVVERLRTQYPEGTRVELVHMNDSYAPPIGTKGTVKGVDDAGSNGKFRIMLSKIRTPPFSLCNQ